MRRDGDDRPVGVLMARSDDNVGDQERDPRDLPDLFSRGAGNQTTLTKMFFRIVTLY